MRVLFHIVVKELLQLRQDKRMLPLLFVAPIVQIVVFGFAVNTDVTDVSLLLVDRDRTAASRELVRSFTGSGYFEIVGVEDEVTGSTSGSRRAAPSSRSSSGRVSAANGRPGACREYR